MEKEKASGFPAQTLLQAQFARVGRERDMQQAVCGGRGVPAGHCFHVAQLWCVVLDNCRFFDVFISCPFLSGVPDRGGGSWYCLLTGTSASVYLLPYAPGQPLRGVHPEGYEDGGGVLRGQAQDEYLGLFPRVCHVVYSG